MRFGTDRTVQQGESGYQGGVRENQQWAVIRMYSTADASGQGDDVFFANQIICRSFREAGYTEDLSDMPVVEKYSGLVAIC